MFRPAMTVTDFEALARSKVDQQAWDFCMTGSDEEITVVENKSAFSNYRIVPKFCDEEIVNCDPRSVVLGENVSCPLGVAPFAFHGLFHEGGDAETAAGAADAGCCFVQSLYSGQHVSTVASLVPGGLKWLQLYVFQNRQASFEVVKCAEKNGYKAMVVTVDLPVISRRRSNLRNPFQLPKRFKLPHIDAYFPQGISTYFDSKLYTDDLTWDDISHLKRVSEIPVIVKGVLTVADAVIAVERCGVDGIWVSSHGGRALDGVLPPVLALEPIVKAVRGRCEVYVDSGVRTGADVFKCLALGANAVFVGRPALWGLAYEGSAGVAQVLNILKDELLEAMVLTGCRDVRGIRRSCVKLTAACSANL